MRYFIVFVGGVREKSRSYFLSLVIRVILMIKIIVKIILKYVFLVWFLFLVFWILWFGCVVFFIFVICRWVFFIFNFVGMIFMFGVIFLNWILDEYVWYLVFFSGIVRRVLFERRRIELFFIFRVFLEKLSFVRSFFLVLIINVLVVVLRV